MSKPCSAGQPYSPQNYQTYFYMKGGKSFCFSLQLHDIIVLVGADLRQKSVNFSPKVPLNYLGLIQCPLG